MIYPWQEVSWKDVTESWGELPNAWLFYSAPNTGSLEWVKEYAQALLCREPMLPNHRPCNQCLSCRLFCQGMHPDFHLVSNDQFLQEGIHQPVIKISMVREVTEKVQLSSHLGGWKVVLIHPAEAMNIQASNALLKVLEEPPHRTIFLLLTTTKEALLPTIISRCRKFSLPKPTQEEALAYLTSLNPDEEGMRFQLALNSGMPFFNPDFPQGIYQDFIQLMCQPRLLELLNFSQKYSVTINSLAYFYDWIYKWLADMILVNAGYEVKFHLLAQEEILHTGGRYPLEELFGLLALIKKDLRSSAQSLNLRLQIESILLEYLLLTVG
ncbi:MAG: DNA polymerase III subunit delta' [Neisseriaceae bacterium]